MTRWLVDVKLEVLIVVNKAPSQFVNGKMGIVLLGEKIDIIPVCYLGFNFNDLTPWLILTPYSMNITVMTCKNF